MHLLHPKRMWICLLTAAAWTTAVSGDSAPADTSAGPGTVAARFVLIGRFGGRGAAAGRMDGPRAVCADPAGFVYVADTGNQRVQKFDSLGVPLAAVGAFGWGVEQFNEPSSVWAGNGLDVFVADYDNGRIERYDRNLHPIASLRSSDEWAESLRFGFPLDVRFTPQSELFCLDGENRRVLKLDARGEPLISFGGLDSGEGRLTGPARLLVTAGNRVLVSDADEGRIAVFDAYGNFLAVFGEGILDRPAGMAESPNGKLLFVCDAGNRRVHIFRGFAYEGSFGGPETPVDAACSADRLYVLDRSGSEVLIYRWNPAAGETSP
jgi:DNA-binding beta-propeller fold protein YncE